MGERLVIAILAVAVPILWLVQVKYRLIEPRMRAHNKKTFIYADLEWDFGDECLAWLLALVSLLGVVAVGYPLLMLGKWILFG